MFVWDPIQVVILQTGDRIVSDANPVRAYLLIVSNHYDRLSDIEEKEALNSQLARFVDDDEVVTAGFGVDHLGD